MKRRLLVRPPSLLDVYFFREQPPHLIRPPVPRGHHRARQLVTTELASFKTVIKATINEAVGQALLEPHLKYGSERFYKESGVGAIYKDFRSRERTMIANGETPRLRVFITHFELESDDAFTTNSDGNVISVTALSGQRAIITEANTTAFSKPSITTAFSGLPPIA